MKTEIERGLLLPLFQATVTGVFVGALVCSLCVWLAKPVVWGSVAGCGAMLFSWLAFRAEVVRRLDISGGVVDVQPGEPVQPEPSFQLEVDFDSGRSGDFLQFGVAPAVFTSWCEGVASGASLAEGVWCGSRGLFSKSQYHAFREELVKAGYMRLSGKHHSQGFSLTAKGSALVRGVARTHTHARNTQGNRDSGDTLQLVG